MTVRTGLQLLLLVIGIGVWGYGQRIDDAGLRWVGIAFFAAAFALRFVGRSARSVEERDAPGGPADGE